MNARKVGRQGQGHAPTALAETENFPEPRPTYLQDITATPGSSAAASHGHCDDGLGLPRGATSALLLEAIAVAAIVGACFLVGFLLAHPVAFCVVVGFAVLAIMATAGRWAT